MIRKLLFGTVLLPALVLICTSPQAAAGSQVSFISHHIRLTIDVPLHMVSVLDSGRVQLHQGQNYFELGRTSGMKLFYVDGESVEFRVVQMADIEQLEPEIKDRLSDIDSSGQAQLVLFDFDRDGTFQFQMDYRAEFYQDVSGIRFSSERVGGEVSGTILDKGAYLSPAAYYYPRGGESLSRFRLTADVPESWESISDGNRLSSETADGRKVQTWENPFKSDGCMFMAAPYVTRSTWVDNVEVACYFFAEDSSLIEDYLTATADYIRMYSDLLGPYPYDRFTVAENYFPTGYGMPAWTLLGQQVLRLPFIKATSLGHEVLHNWWGNSVYVDYDRGNWCEAATVYGADYRYKLMSSPAAAKAYRKNILKQYDSYVTEGNDFPIRAFQSRSSPNTRTIGYGKAMMVYHMIEQEIGTESFFDAWKQIYSDYREKQISWEEWIDAFEKASGSDLSHVIPQWIDRPGAPVLDIAVVPHDPNLKDAGRSVQLRLMEKSGQSYRLTVPLRFSGPEVVWDTSLVLVTEDSIFTLPLPDGAVTVEADPEYHLFRHLYPEEIEPVISATMGNPEKWFVTDASASMASDFATFGENLSGDSVEIIDTEALDAGERTGAPVFLNPSTLPTDLMGRVTPGSDSVVVDGVSYSATEHTFVLAGKGWNGYDEYLVILCQDGSSLPRIGQLVPHYGKYSFLVFDGSKNVGKGQWTVSSSPLRRSLQ